VWGLRSPPVTNPLTALALPAYAPRAYTSRQSTVRPISSLRRLLLLLSGPPCCVRVCAVREASSRVSPPQRPREDRLTQPTDTSRSNLAFTLGLLSRWRLSKP
jgi:hypothetical protein